MLYNLRKDYVSGEMELTDLNENPIRQFHNWFQAAILANVNEPNAMTLATCTPDGKPSARIVLLKNYEERGFTFFTNYESRKGEELRANPYAALVFFWREQHRQVRIEGKVEKIPAEHSEEYFQSRPIGSQIGAWSSPQSKSIPNREALVSRVESTQKRFEGQDKLPLPEFWGGYLLRPTAIEFWQGQRSRLHDRFRYELQADDNWSLERLAP